MLRKLKANFVLKTLWHDSQQDTKLFGDQEYDEPNI